VENLDVNDNISLSVIVSAVNVSSVVSNSIISTLLPSTFCRLVCLRVHPTFTVLHPSESFVSFTSMDGSVHEVFPDSGEQFFEGNLIPNGNMVISSFY